MVKKLALYQLAYSDMYVAFLFYIFNISDNFLTSKFDIYAHLFEMFENDSPFLYNISILSYDVASGSEITPCNKIDKPLMVYRFTGNVMTSITTLHT